MPIDFDSDPIRPRRWSLTENADGTVTWKETTGRNVRFKIVHHR
jgi:hypothetical protein